MPRLSAVPALPVVRAGYSLSAYSLTPLFHDFASASSFGSLIRFLVPSPAVLPQRSGIGPLNPGLDDSSIVGSWVVHLEGCGHFQPGIPVLIRSESVELHILFGGCVRSHFPEQASHLHFELFAPPPPKLFPRIIDPLSRETMWLLLVQLVQEISTGSALFHVFASHDEAKRVNLPAGLLEPCQLPYHFLRTFLPICPNCWDPSIEDLFIALGEVSACQRPLGCILGVTPSKRARCKPEGHAVGHRHREAKLCVYMTR